MKLNCRLHQIAKAIRKANGKCEKIEANKFHEEIEKLCYVADDVNGHIPTYEGTEILPTREPITIKGNQYIREDLIVRGDKTIPRQFNTEELINEYYGYHVADVARSYHLARMSGEAEFRYSQSKGIWDTDQGLLTDAEGRCYLDCSGFAGLVLRGIEFKDTPYYRAKGIPNRHLSDYGMDNTIIYDLCAKSHHDWANRYLDRQTDDTLKDIGLCNFYSVRNAAQIAEYYYSHGKVIHEFKNSPTTIPGGIKPGDLLFWSKEGASDFQKERFKSISHVGIVARDTTKYYQVTGYADERITDTVFCSNLVDNVNELVLVLRPNYIPIAETTPTGMNLLSEYAYDSCMISASTSSNGIKYSPQVSGGFNIERTATSSSNSTFYIIRETNPLRLSKGTYKVSGVPSNSDASETPTVYDWGLAVKEVKGDNLVWDKGSDKTFTLSKATNVYVYFFVSKSVEMDKIYNCVPRLERIS